MTDNSRRCANCRHFTTDYNSQFSRDELNGMGLGYCMYNIPSKRLVLLECLCSKSAMVSVPPMVESCCWCGKFAVSKSDEER